MSNSSQHKATSGYDKGDINVKVTVVVTISIIALIVFSVVVLNEYFISVREEIVQSQVLSAKSEILIELHAAEEELLSSYGIIDSMNNVYHIPIDRAMELQAVEATKESAVNSR